MRSFLVGIPEGQRLRKVMGILIMVLGKERATKYVVWLLGSESGLCNRNAPCTVEKVHSKRAWEGRS